MLRWLKRGIALTAALTLLCCTSFAQDPLTLYTTQARFEDGNLSVLCRSNLADPTPEAFTGMLGTIDLQPEEVRPYQESGLGTTCLFLADVSGSISEQDITTIREIALQINSGLSAEDNGAVMTVGNEAYGNPITDDPAQREQQIAAISGVGEDTNLYASMIEALDLLTTSQDANFQKCLVVLSDGEDDYTTGVTREEVEKKIDETGIPVYTVAIVRDSYDTQKVEAAKVLGSFRYNFWLGWYHSPRGGPANSAGHARFFLCGFFCSGFSGFGSNGSTQSNSRGCGSKSGSQFSF